MMCAYLLRDEHHAKHGRLYMASERFFDRILSWYRTSLHWALDNPVLILTILVLTVALNVAVIWKIPTGFFPQQDTGSLAGGVQGPQDSSFPAMNDSIQRLEAVIQKDPAVENVIASQAGRAPPTPGIYLSPSNRSTNAKSARPTSSIACVPSSTPFLWPPLSCRLPRTSASADVRATHCTNTPFRPTTFLILLPGDPKSSPR
jgi:multidrug efflux pump